MRGKGEDAGFSSKKTKKRQKKRENLWNRNLSRGKLNILLQTKAGRKKKKGQEGGEVILTRIC